MVSAFLILHRPNLLEKSLRESRLCFRRGIGLGYAPTTFAKPDTACSVDIRGKILPAVTGKPPFYRKGEDGASLKPSKYTKRPAVSPNTHE